MKLYDVLVKAGGKKLEDIGNLVGRHDGSQRGKLTLDLIRGGKPQTVTVTLGKRPQGLGRPAAVAERPGALAKLLERLRREGAKARCSSASSAPA